MAKYHDELFEILLDEETMVAFNGGEVAWWKLALLGNAMWQFTLG
jgi:hypothetical protein